MQHRTRTRCLTLLTALLLPCLTLLHAAETAPQDLPTTTTTGEEAAPPPPAPRPPAERFHELLAKERQDIEAIGNLLTRHPHIVNEPHEGATPLFMAVEQGNVSLAAELLRHGANPTIANGRGDTPLHEAVRRTDEAMIELLAHAPGTNIYQANLQRQTPLDLATTPEFRALLLGARTGFSIEEEDVLAYLPAWAHPLVTKQFIGIPLWRVVAVALIILIVLVVNTVLRHYIAHASRAADRKEGIGTDTAPSPDAEDDALAINPEKPRSFLALSVLAARRGIKLLIWGLALEQTLPLLVPEFRSEADYLGSVLYSLALAVFLFDYVDVLEYYMNRYAKKTETKLDEKIVPLFKKSLRIVVVVVAGLQLYQTVSGNSIASVIAGLGIGAMAVALAATDTLKNLIGFVMILLDKPYAIGERIIFDGHDGIVEQIGVRTTRLRRLDGHVACIPNSKAVDSVLHNVGKRPFIKRTMDITITYDTPVAKIEEAVQIVKDILDNHEGMNPERPPRVYFSELNADSLSINATYWYFPAEYYDYMAFSERVNFELMRRFEAAGIEFAFPTQTLYLAGDPNRKLRIETAPGTGSTSAAP